MEIWAWISQNWFDFFSSVGIVGGLWFTAFSVFLDAKAHRLEAKAHRVTNLLTIAKNHREIWTEFLNNEKLWRVRDENVDLKNFPLTDAERAFVTLIIVHTNTSFYATDNRLVVEYEGLRQDVAKFFSLPIPQAVWLKVKPLQNHDFAVFIEDSLKKRTPLH